MRKQRVVVVAAAVSVGLLGLAAFALGTRRSTVKVDAGPVGERIVARAQVEPSAGVRRVFAAADGKVTKVFAHEGESVDEGKALAELEVAGQTRTLNAPQRAVVLTRRCEVGDYALAAERGASQPLFELADPSQTELRVEVEETDAANVAAGQAASISAIGSKEQRLAGQVTRVSARLSRRVIGAEDARVRADGLVRVATVAWRGAQPGWPLGTRAEVILEVRRREAAARVPRAAVTVRDGRTIVERPLALGATREVPVEVLSVDDAYAEVRGVAPGTEVLLPDGS